MNELSVAMSPLENSPQLRSDEEFVQTMWVAVRYHYDTDMQPFTFSKLVPTDKLKWAIALRQFVCSLLSFNVLGFGFAFAASRCMRALYIKSAFGNTVG